MFRLVVALGAVVAGSVGAGAALLVQDEPPALTRFDSTTELATLIERVRPNNIVLQARDPVRIPAVLVAGQAPDSEGSVTERVGEAWSLARASIVRVARVVRDSTMESPPTFVAAPCGEWEDLGPKAVEGPQGAETRRVRTLCGH